MAVSPHPSVRPSAPTKPPEDRTGQGKRESGIRGERYGASRDIREIERPPAQDYGHAHEVEVKPRVHESDRRLDFHDSEDVHKHMADHHGHVDGHRGEEHASHRERERVAAEHERKGEERYVERERRDREDERRGEERYLRGKEHRAMEHSTGSEFPAPKAFRKAGDRS